jgi:hypothetical protein
MVCLAVPGVALAGGKAKIPSRPSVASTAVGAGNANKLEGAWVARVVEVPGGQWSYVVSPDPSGRRATGHGTIDVGLYVPGIDELADGPSPLLIDVVMTGPDTAKFNSIWYGLKKVSGGMTTAEVAYIGVNWGELKFVAPNKLEGTHNIEYYLPSADADHDGMPDPGAVPVGGAQVHTVDTRLPSSF